MAPKTLAHHRKSDNRYVFTFGVQTITVTRRFLPSRAVRVRVTSETISGKGEGNWTDHRDFTDMHEGDAAYGKQASNWCAKWEERYVSSRTKKEAPVAQEPTQEPTHSATPEADTDRQPTATQWAGGATMTPARAAELATRRTGVQHVVGEDGHTLCRREQPAQLNSRGAAALAATGAVQGKITGKVLGEWTLPLKGRRLGRTAAMGILLKQQTDRLREAELSLHAIRSGVAATTEAVSHTADLQTTVTYFRALRDAGYAEDTTWDELIEMLRPIVSTVLYVLEDERRVLPALAGPTLVTTRRNITACETFLTACAPVLSFFQPDDEGEDGACPDCGETLDEVEEGPEAGEQTCPNNCDRT